MSKPTERMIKAVEFCEENLEGIPRLSDEDKKDFDKIHDYLGHFLGYAKAARLFKDWECEEALGSCCDDDFYDTEDLS
jgi:hypothetical protein